MRSHAPLTPILTAANRSAARPRDDADGQNGKPWQVIEVSPTTWLLMTSQPLAADAIAEGLDRDPATIEISEQHRDRLRRILREITDDGVGPAHAPQHALPSQPLTLRQSEIAMLVREGASNKAIARALGLTVGTVKVHLHRIYKVLGISSRVELAIHAAETALQKR